MGGRKKRAPQIDPQKADIAFGRGAEAAQQLQAMAGQGQAQSSALYDLLFGVPGAGGGTLARFLDPTSLNVDRPTGPYGLQYSRAIQNIAQNYQNQRGALTRYLTNRGFAPGAGPSGFEADLYRRLAQSQADTQGQAFTDYAAKAYEDALRNFWRATGLTAEELQRARGAALGAQSGAANTYSQLYGIAGRPSPPQPSKLNTALRVGGAIATAALACPAEGSLILMADGSERHVEQLRKDDRLASVDGGEEVLVDDPVRDREQPCVELHLSNELIARCSESHTLLRKAGGYVRAGAAHGAIVKTAKGPARVVAVRPIPPLEVFRLTLDRSHTYRFDGIWAEE